MIERFLSKYREPATLIWRYGRSQHGVIIGFVALAVFAAMTESLGVFLLVPLLESMGEQNIFGNTPLFSVISDFFEALPAESRLIWAGCIMLVIVLVRGVLQFATEYIGYSIPHRVDCHLRIRAYRALLRTSMRFVDSVGAGDIGNSVIAYPARIGITLRFIGLMLAHSALLLCYIAVLVAVAPVIFIFAAIYIFVTTLIFKRLSTPVVQRVGRDLTKADRQFSQTFYETLNGAKLIRLSGASSIVQAEVEDTVGILRRARLHTAAVENITYPFFSTIGGVAICVLVMMVSLIPKEMVAQTVGVLIIFIVLVFRILGPLTIINICRNNVLIHLEAFYMLDDFFRRAEEAQEVDGDTQLAQFSEGIRMENVSFAYKDDGPPVLSDVTLNVERGKMVAVVGPSGSGKSTLINLITRLYRPTHGQILVDGLDLNTLVAETWWRNLSVVTQETILTNDTVRANICFGLSEDVSMDKIRAAAATAAIDTWIEEQPEGYDTVLGDRGSQLSGGQRQRLVLARAFLREPEILILDEATSALDALTERAVQRGINSLMGKTTIIVIAHRLSTVKRADAIIVLDAGRLVEVGSHRELLERQGIYWAMSQSQSLDLEDDEDEDAEDSKEAVG